MIGYEKKTLQLRLEIVIRGFWQCFENKKNPG